LTFVIKSIKMSPFSIFKAWGINPVNKNPYTWAGLSLLIAGVLISVPAYFLFHLVWLTALGICMLILSLILIALGKAVPKLPPEVCSLLMETGADNISTLIEELGIKSKAIYLPSSLASKYPRAFIPLHSNGVRPEITKALPQRLIARYGSNPEDIGLLITTIGSTTAGMLETKPGATADELEAALTSLLTGRLGIADGARVICQNDHHIQIDINRPRLENGNSWSHQCLGGPMATVVASVAAEAWNKPMTISREEQVHGTYHVELEVGR
jgi:hypothetical protein